MKEKNQNSKNESISHNSGQILQDVIDAQKNLIVFSLDKNYKYTSFSKSHKNTMKLIWGKDIEIGKSMLDYIPREDDRKKAKYNFDRVFNGESFILEEEYGTDEHRSYWEDHYSPIKDEAGEIIGVSVFVVNITRRKNIEIELKEKESELRATFYSIGDAVITTDNNGRVVKMTSIAEELCGWKEEEAEGKELPEVFNIINSFTRRKVENPVDRVFKEGIVVGLANHTILVPKNGDEHQIADSAAPIIDKDGNITGAVLVFRDVTEKYKMENELKLKKEFNDAVLQAIPDLLFVINDKYEFVFYNVPGEKTNVLYEEPENFIGRSIFDVLPADVAEESAKNIDFVLKNKKPVKFNYKLVIDGKENSFSTRFVYKGENEVLVVVTDVTELEKAENKLRTIFDVTPYPMHLVNNNFEILLTNKHLLETKGLKQDDILGRKCYEVYQNNNDICENCVVKKVIDTKEPQSIFAKLKNAEGKTKFFETIAFPIKEENGEVIEIIASTIDITERKIAEEKVKESEERLLTLINSTPDIICFKDGEGRWLTANEADLKLFRLENVDYYGKTDAELAEYTDPIYKESFLNCIKTDEAAWAKKELSIAEETIPLVEGGEKIFEVIKVPLFNDDGTRKGLVVLGRDITKRKITEQELKRSQEDFKNIIESSLFGIVIHSEGKFVYVNNAALKIGNATSKEEFLSKPPSSFVHPDYLDLAEERIKKMAETGKGVGTVIEKFVRMDGKTIFVRNSATPVKFEGKNAFLVLFEDITKQIENEEKVRENEKVFRTLTDTTTAAIFVFDREKFLYVNKTTERITGYSSEELLKMNFWSVVHPDFREVVKKRGQMRIKGNRVPESYEFMILNKSGKGIWINFSASKITWKGKNAALGSAVDISKRKAVELDLIKSERKYKLISKLTTDYIFESEIDDSGNITTVWASDSFEKITGYSLEEFRKRGDWGSIVHPDDYLIEKESASNILNNRIGIAEVRIFRKDGSLIWVKSKGEPIWSKEKQRVVGVVGAVSDITERKMMVEELIQARQKAEASEKIKTDFLAQMSHEIRSPLNVVLNFISLLKMELGENIDEEMEMAFSSIDSSSRRIIRTVDLILNMTELQTGTYHSVNEEVDLVKQVENVFSEYKQAAKVKKLDFEFIRETEKLKIFTDGYAFLQTVVNLIDNAIKYTNEGGVTIILSAKSHDEALFEIKDTGIGISEEYLPQIFSAFSQEEQGYKRKFEGNGLGLALVKKYVDIMHGRITVKSKKGKGTTFTLIVPNLRNIED